MNMDCGLNFTFAEGNTVLHGLVLVSWSGIQEGARAAVINEASCVLKRSEISARGLGWLLVTLDWVQSCIDTGKECESCRSNSK